MDAGNMRVMHTSQGNSGKLENLRNTLKASLKSRVSKVRGDLHYSQGDMQEELARFGLERTQSSLSHIENGVRLPSVEMLYVMARYLKTSTDYLLGLTDNGLSAADIEEDLAAGGQSAIDRLFKALPPDKQKQVFQFAEYLLSRHTSGRSDSAAKNERPEESEDEQITREIEVLLDSIERTHGKAVRDEIEKVFRSKGFGIGKTS